MEQISERSRAKAERRTGIVAAATRLFAERGYARVSLDEIGAAAGVSGPAVYRHFATKHDILAAVLIEVSERLHDGGVAVTDTRADAATTLRELVTFHSEFALGNPDVIRVQDRDLDSLGPSERHRVRSLQRAYIELWVDTLGTLLPDESTGALTLRAQASFGLLNSTPHSIRGSAAATAASTGVLLQQMALAALTAPDSPPAGDHGRLAG